jgi:porin
MRTKLKSGEPLSGVGIFARVGYSPAETNIIDRTASVGFFAHGLLGWQELRWLWNRILL